MPVGLGPSSPTAHVWALRRMEAEIMERLYYSQSHTDDSALSTWDSEIRVRLAAWHQATRQSVSLSEKLEFAEIHYHMQRLRLSRPSPRRPVPLPEQQKECLAAAVAVLREFDVIARLGKLFYIWHAAHCVVEAGICLLAVAIEASTASSNTSITATSEVRTTEIMSVGDVPILTRHLKTFPGILWKIARRWPAIVHHAATLESLSTAVAERLQQWAAGTLTATTSTSSSPGTSAAAIKQKLKDMSLFSPFPMDAEAARRAQEELSRLQSLRGLGTVNSADSAADVNTAQTTVTDADITAPFDANWALPPLSPGQVLAFSSSATLVDGTVTAASTDDVLDWDFAGVGFEEIFAALIQANHGEGEDENTQGNQASELVS
ncbi:hypothetical protein SBRCBS47491_000618 [Sporothrix bragantina]|uniref:Uncharacterized protein n=1 Tax=Sporothrix bragantina TaxID=671064 RepID=A0ABP0ARS8_9PEZI